MLVQLASKTKNKAWLLFLVIQQWKEHSCRTQCPSDPGQCCSSINEVQFSFPMRSKAEAHHRDYLGSLYPLQRHSPFSILLQSLVTTNRDNLSLQATKTCLDVPAWENEACQPWSTSASPISTCWKLLVLLRPEGGLRCWKESPGPTTLPRDEGADHHVASLHLCCVVSGPKQTAWLHQLTWNEPWFLQRNLISLKEKANAGADMVR